MSAEKDTQITLTSYPQPRKSDVLATSERVGRGSRRYKRPRNCRHIPQDTKEVQICGSRVRCGLSNWQQLDRSVTRSSEEYPSERVRQQQCAVRRHLICRRLHQHTLPDLWWIDHGLVGTECCYNLLHIYYVRGQLDRCRSNEC